MSSTHTERLLAITLVLLSTKRPLSRSEIRDAVGDYPAGQKDDSFERMFERDKDELRGMGIPIESVDIDETEGVGYKLSSSGPYLKGITLDADERLVVAMAARMWQEATWGHDSLNALRKLELAGDFTSAGSAGVSVAITVNSSALTALLEATHDRKRVEFSYRKAGSGQAELRSVLPWGVVAERGQWYLVGHDTAREATRAFRFSRIVGGIATKKAVDYDVPDVSLHELVRRTFSSGQTQDLVVSLASGRSNRLRLLASEIVTGTDGQRDTATFASADPDRIVPDILAAGDGAQVLEPADVRERVIEALTKVRDQAAAAPSITDKDRSELAKAESSPPASKAAEPAVARVSRLLAMVPWLRSHNGVTYEQLAEHFNVTKEQLRDDLALAVCTEFGANNTTLDMEVFGDSILVYDTQGIDAPLNLTRSEAISLLIGLRLLSQVPGAGDRETLARVISTIEAAAGDMGSLADHVSIPEVNAAEAAASAAATTVLAAANEKRAVRIEYWSASRDELSERVVDPIKWFSTGGASYLEAWCRTAQAVRMFRADRIRAAELLDEPSSPPAGIEPSVRISPEGEIVIFDVDVSAAWWADQLPSQAAYMRPDGSMLISAAVASRSWALRSVLAFGGQIRVIEPADLAAEIQAAADSALWIYAN